MTTSEEMRDWRKTPAGKRYNRANNIANAQAAKWVRVNHPDVWMTLMEAARVKVGLPTARTPTGKFGKEIKHGSPYGATAHRLRGESVCDECKAAQNNRLREYRAEVARRKAWQKAKESQDPVDTDKLAC